MVCADSSAASHRLPDVSAHRSSRYAFAPFITPTATVTFNVVTLALAKEHLLAIVVAGHIPCG